MEIHEALEDIEIAFRQLEFASKLLSFCELGQIDPLAFDNDQLVTFDKGESLHSPTGHFSDSESLIRAANIFVSTAFSATALVLDKALHVAGIERNPKFQDNIGQARILIYMVLCAQAHSIADPRWEVHGDFRRALKFDVNGLLFSVDLRDLHSKAFSIEQIGGYPNWFRLRNAVIRIVGLAKA